jgi:hypothetical protein
VNGIQNASRLLEISVLLMVSLIFLKALAQFGYFPKKPCHFRHAGGVLQCSIGMTALL